ncbi:unnamed protein product [Prorocentrum cordatum]|uniref:Uncharacterized protein n=1 Tax=Prorocentrum cordatum TaxID=2364126 RepID=A0ABN9Y6Q8_9DINO|nr:unnamed protein product [Polarella glacialis]
MPLYATSRDQFSPPEFSAETLALIKHKQYIQRLTANAGSVTSFLAKSLQSSFNQAHLAAKRAVRAEKRQRIARQVAEAENAEARQDIRRCFAIVKRLAPKPQLPVLTVQNPLTKELCMDDAEDLQVRTAALCDIFEADEIPMENPGGPSDLNTPSDAGGSIHGGGGEGDYLEVT